MIHKGYFAGKRITSKAFERASCEWAVLAFTNKGGTKMIGILSSLLGSIVVVSGTLVFCAVVRDYARVRSGLSEKQK